MARRLDACAKTFEAEFARLLEGKREAEEDVSSAVKDIIADVRARGDAALVELSARFDRARLTPETLRLEASAVEQAERACSKEAKDALQFAASRIEAYHKRQLPKDESFT